MASKAPRTARGTSGGSSSEALRALRISSRRWKACDERSPNPPCGVIDCCCESKVGKPQGATSKKGKPVTPSRPAQGPHRRRCGLGGQRARSSTRGKRGLLNAGLHGPLGPLGQATGTGGGQAPGRGTVALPHRPSWLHHEAGVVQLGAVEAAHGLVLHRARQLRCNRRGGVPGAAEDLVLRHVHQWTRAARAAKDTSRGCGKAKTVSVSWRRAGRPPAASRPRGGRCSHATPRPTALLVSLDPCPLAKPPDFICGPPPPPFWLCGAKNVNRALAFPLSPTPNGRFIYIADSPRGPLSPRSPTSYFIPQTGSG